MYTIWTSSTRFEYHPPLDADKSRGNVQETAYWFEPVAVASGLSHVQAIGLIRELSDAAVIPGAERIRSAGYGPRDRRELAAEMAFGNKTTVTVRSYWATQDGVGPEGELLMDTVAGEATPAGNFSGGLFSCSSPPA
jgi:hypothetical protein